MILIYESECIADLRTVRCPAEKKLSHVSSATDYELPNCMKPRDIRRIAMRPCNERCARFQNAAVGTPYDGRALIVAQRTI